jgi:hypothetical protein
MRIAGDGVIFEAGKPAMMGGRQIGSDVIKVQVESNVTVEIAVARVAGIALLPAPDLAGCFQIAPKRGDAVWGEDGGEDAVARSGLALRIPWVSTMNQRSPTSWRVSSIPSV